MRQCDSVLSLEMKCLIDMSLQAARHTDYKISPNSGNLIRCISLLQELSCGIHIFVTLLYTKYNILCVVKEEGRKVCVGCVCVCWGGGGGLVQVKSSVVSMGDGVITFSFCFERGEGANEISKMDRDLSHPPPPPTPDTLLKNGS